MTGSPSGVIGRDPAHGVRSPSPSLQAWKASRPARRMASTLTSLTLSSVLPNSMVPARRSIPFSGVTATRASSRVSEVRSSNGAGE